MSDQKKKQLAAVIAALVQIMSFTAVLSSLPESWHKPMMAIIAVLSAIQSQLPKIMGEAPAEKVVEMTAKDVKEIKP